MAYCSQAQLVALHSSQLIESLTDDSSAGSIQSDKVDAAIAEAQREIDGYCRAKYAVPFTGTIPPLVVSIALVLSMYGLYRRRAQSFGIPSDAMDEYKMRLAQLEKINSGKLDLGVDPEPAVSTKPHIKTDGPGRLFTDHSDADDGSSTLDGF